MRRFCAARVLAAAAATVWATELTVAVAAAQTPRPGGIPDVCANPTTTSARSGSCSDPLTWSPARVPSAGDLVRIDAGDTVTYTSVTDAALNRISIFGQLAFGTGAPTRLTVGTLTVMEGGILTIGTVCAPVPAGITAELVIANQPLNTSLDPDRFGTGLLGLGTVTMYGAEKTPTWTRLATEPRAVDTTLTLSQPVIGWRAGDRLILPDTRHLKWNEVGNWTRTTAQWEQGLLPLTAASTSRLPVDNRAQRDRLPP